MRNEAGDVAGDVVQARDVHGGVNFHRHEHERWQPEVPQQVPMYVRASGREAELSRLDSLRERVRVISGIEGVGKSTLAHDWSEQARETFSGGQLYVDLSRYRDRAWATAINDVLAMFLRAFGVPEDVVPAQRAERESMFRTLTARRPVLVVIDSAWSANEVLPLVPGGAGVVLVTSNDKLGELVLHGARRPLVLAPLGDDDSLALLTDVIGEEMVAAAPDEALALVRKCAGLPLAIRLLAARLVADDGLTVADLVDELGNGLAAFSVSGRQALTELFDGVLAKLPASARRLYRLLGAAELQDFGHDVASALLGEDAKGALAALTRANLLMHCKRANLLMDDKRYRFHGLIAAHAQETATDAERGAGDMALDWSLTQAAFADRAITGRPRLLVGGQDQLTTGENPFQDSKAAIEWLDAERANLLPLLRNSREDETVWRVAESLTPYYYNCRYLQEWVEVTELGIAAARRCDQPDATARLLTTLSRPLLDQGELDRAKQGLDEALELATRDDVRASVHEFRGRYFDKVGRHAEAIDAYRTAQRLTDDPRAIALATCFLGATLAKTGDPVAEETLREAVRLLENEPRMRARALTALSTVVPDEAAELLREAVAVLENRWPAPEAEARLALAKVLDGAEATEQLRRAHAIYARYGSPKADELAKLLPEPGVDE